MSLVWNPFTSWFAGPKASWPIAAMYLMWGGLKAILRWLSCCPDHEVCYSDWLYVYRIACRGNFVYVLWHLAYRPLKMSHPAEILGFIIWPTWISVWTPLLYCILLHEQPRRKRKLLRASFFSPVKQYLPMRFFFLHSLWLFYWLFFFPPWSVLFPLASWCRPLCHDLSRSAVA